MDPLDQKLLDTYYGKVVRKDLLHEVKKGSNVPSFVLEYLLARFCASDDPQEIESGKQAVFETIQQNYVRPNEANRAQSTVQQKGNHVFIDKLHVNYIEREKTHWAAMENFDSRRIAINERFYKDNDRLLEGGIWAEVTVGHNDVEDDDYAFYVEDMRPVQLARFDFEVFCEGRRAFTRDEWIDVILRTIGLEPSIMDKRLKFHHIARLLPFVEQNYNLIELGPRGNGKSYTYSEFSPYCTLLSGSQPTASTLFYNNARKKVGVIGFWDVVGFDEIGTMKIKDQDAIQLMKDYMSNGRFNRGTEVIANASMVFVGNLDDSIAKLVESPQGSLFKPLAKAIDLAILHRLYMYVPGWEVPQPSIGSLTSNYGFITEYLAEAMHHMWKRVNKSGYVQDNCKFGSHVVGRDEKAALKTISAFLKLLHPHGEPSGEELTEYVEYALEGRRRVKEQLYKQKPDEEFEDFQFSYFTKEGEEVVVHCPESKGKIGVSISQESHSESEPELSLSQPVSDADKDVDEQNPNDEKAQVVPAPAVEEKPLKEEHIKIRYDSKGYGYETLFLKYMQGAKAITIEDPYIRAHHQITNFLRFCDVVVKAETIRTISLKTASSFPDQEDETKSKLFTIAESLKDCDIELKISFDGNMHDREINLDNGWTIKIGRGLDYFQRPEDWLNIGANDLDLRPCLETSIDIFKESSA
jgi:ATP-dependent Lon protease